MSGQDQKWVEDVEDLLKSSVVEEATNRVMAAFETALSNLDPDSAEVLKRHFDGISAERLSREKNVSEEEMRAWLKQAKRKVMEGLRREFAVRQ